jgi:hypothetical protein
MAVLGLWVKRLHSGHAASRSLTSFGMTPVRDWGTRLLIFFEFATLNEAKYPPKHVPETMRAGLLSNSAPVVCAAPECHYNRTGWSVDRNGRNSRHTAAHAKIFQTTNHKS